MKVFVITTDDGDLIGVAANKETAIRIMTEYMINGCEKYNWFKGDDWDYTLDEAITDIESGLQAEGFIFAEPTDFWNE